MIIITKKTTAGLLMMIVSLFILIFGISITVKSVGDLPDFHSITSDTAKADTFVEGNINEWYGPVAKDGVSEYYFLPLDNGQLITYSNSDKNYNEIMGKYEGEIPENVEDALKIHCMIVEMSQEEEECLKSILIDSGYEESEIDQILLPYCLVNYPLWFYIFIYIISIGGMIIGFILFLPKLRALFNNNGTSNVQFSDNNTSSNINTEYQSVNVAETYQTNNFSTYQSDSINQGFQGEPIINGYHNHINANEKNVYNNDSY